MKSDHRHELKTNELADWLAHFPEWMKQNRTNILAVAAVIVLAIIVYFWSYYRSNVVSVRRQAVCRTWSPVLPSSQRGRACGGAGHRSSYALMPLAQDLQESPAAVERQHGCIGADQAGRSAGGGGGGGGEGGGGGGGGGWPSRSPRRGQLSAALDRKPRNPGLAAAAQFGLGLCEEELGNFDKAAEIYRETAAKPEYAGTLAQAAAQYRLQVMDDFRTPVVFKPAPPQPEVSQDSVPTIQIGPQGSNVQTMIPAPTTPNVDPVPQAAPADATPAAPPTTVDANQPTGG